MTQFLLPGPPLPLLPLPLRPKPFCCVSVPCGPKVKRRVVCSLREQREGKRATTVKLPRWASSKRVAGELAETAAPVQRYVASGVR